MSEVPSRVGRRLAAIVAADVAGYSRLMGLDEVGTARTLREHRAVTDALVAKHGGRIVKTTGDGVLLEFPSVVDAVECAVALQAVMAERNEGVPEDRRMLLRIGINLGDILIEGDDILGDGVNIAARLEGIAEPGGICISSSAYEQVRGKVANDFTDLGEQTLKNIARPVRAFALRAKGEPVISSSKGTALPLPDKPSIAVLPFQNMSGDPEQEYFADGMVEDITTELSRFKSLFVIARNSSFTYKGKIVDIREVGRDLGVRYVLEGSVRKAGGRVRITGQLIDSTTGAYLWADRFEGALEDVFELQDRVAESVVGAIAPKVEQAEIERIKRKPTNNLDAFDCFLRAKSYHYQYTREALRQALQLLYRAIELDEAFSAPYGLAANCYLQRRVNGWVDDLAFETTEAARLAGRVSDLGFDDAHALCAAGATLALLGIDFANGAAMVERGLLLNPNLAIGWRIRSFVETLRNRPEAGIEWALRALRLSPLDPLNFLAKGGLALAYFSQGKYVESYQWAIEAAQDKPTYSTGMRLAVASAALAGRTVEMKEGLGRLRKSEPELRLSNLASRTYAVGDYLSRMAEGLRLAGLPE